MRENSGKFRSRDWTNVKTRDFTVLRRTEEHSNGYAVWEAKCDFCGEVKKFPSYYFKRGHCSCGCSGWQGKWAEKIGRKPLPNKQSHVNIIYAHYRRSARDRNIEFTLSKEQIRELIEQDCHYCGQKPIVRYTSESCAGQYEWNGIDRVDNSKGYIEGNCVPCCKTCNFAKRDLTLIEFENWLERAYQKMKERG